MVHSILPTPISAPNPTCGRDQLWDPTTPIANYAVFTGSFTIPALSITFVWIRPYPVHAQIDGCLLLSNDSRRGRDDCIAEAQGSPGRGEDPLRFIDAVSRSPAYSVNERSLHSFKIRLRESLSILIEMSLYTKWPLISVSTDDPDDGWIEFFLDTHWQGSYKLDLVFIMS